MNLKWSNSLTEKHKQARRGCEPVRRAPATVKHMGDRRVGLSGVTIKIQCR